MPTHAGFIIAAYAVTVLVLGGALGAVILDGRAQRRALAALADRLARDGRGNAAGDQA